MTKAKHSKNEKSRLLALKRLNVQDSSAPDPGSDEVKDIHEQQKTNQLLLASEAKFRALSDTSPLGIFSTDETGACIYTNARWQMIFGLSYEESLGAGWADTLHPDDRDKVYENWQQTTEKQLEFDMEFRVRYLSGKVHYVHSRARPMFDSAGELTGYVGSIEDVTKQRQNLERLVFSEERLRKLYQSTPAMLQSIDVQGRLISVSDFWLERHGYSRNEVIGRFSTDFMTPESAKYAMEVVIPNLFKHGHCENIAYQKVKKSGEIFDVLLSSVVEYDEYHQPICGISVSIDVTAENAAKRATNALLDAIRSQFVVSITGAKGTIIDVNDAFCKLSQYSRDELLDANHRLINSGTHSTSFFTEMWQTITHGHSWKGEICNRAKDGTLYWVDSVISPLMDNQASVERFISISADITERKLAEIEIKEEKQYLASVIQGTGAGTWQWNVATGICKFNEQWASMLGYRLDELGNQMYETWARLAHPEDIMQATLAINRHFRGEAEMYETEFRMRHKAGHWVWILSRGRVFTWTEDKQPAWMYGTHTDITVRKSQEVALKAANERIALATRSGRIGIWSINFANNVLTCDNMILQLHGLAEDTVLSIEYWFSLLHADDYEKTKRAFEDALIGIADYDVEYRAIWPDSSVHYLRASAIITRDEQGDATYMVGTNWDVTELRQLTAEVSEQHELLRVTLQSIGDAVITTDAKGNITWLNPVAERMTAWSTQEAKGRDIAFIFNIMSESSGEPIESPVNVCLQTRKVSGLAKNSILISRDGHEYGIENSAAPIHSEDGKLLGAVLVFHDVTEQRRLTNEMSFRATHDALTGLINRSEFEARLERLLNHSKTNDSMHAIMYIDLDQFKLINDACGHSAGDLLLTQVSKIFQDIVRSRDTLARIGGDEFAVIMEKCTTDQAQRVAKFICERMDEYRFIHENKGYRVGASIGLAPLDKRWSNITAVMQTADAACYLAKEAGRNRVHTWFDSDVLMSARQSEMQWATRIEQALDHDQFVLFAQKIHRVGADTERIYAEILLRLAEVNGKFITPNAFLPAAERFHLVSRIDRWVLNSAITWLQGIQDLSRVDTICVNISGQSVGDRAFHRLAFEMLSHAGKAICECLCLEITETATVTNIIDASLFIEQVRRLGVRIALDDFGAGASSFGYLKSLKVDILKIDGEYIKSMINNKIDDSAVRCFVDIAQILNLKTVAEYVENAEILAHVKTLGIHYAQGYLIHKPEPIHRLFDTASTGFS